MYIPDRAETRLNALISGDMHLCSGKSAPAPPDYRAAAEETAAGNKEMLDLQTQANRPNQYTPFGATEWTKDDQGNWTQNTSLNDQSQSALDAQLDVTRRKSELGSNLYGRVEEDFANRLDYGNLPDWAGPLQGGADARQNAEDAIYGRSTSRLDPQWEQRTSQTEAKLAAQGLRPGDPAYDQAIENMGRERNDAYQQAQYGSIMGGGQEATRQQGMDLQAGNFQNQGRQAQLAEAMQKRGFNLNEINALLTGQQVGMPNAPKFNTAGRTEGADYSGAAQNKYQGQQDQFSADQALWQGVLQGGTSLAMMSDRRLKKNVSHIGMFKQYPCYLFQYIWGQWAIGVMADEINQDAVIMTPSGFAAVDYGRIR